MGVNPGDLGNHILSKDVSTMESDGCTVYTTIILLCIRCVCYMVVFKEIYIKYEAYGDKYVGSCASSLYKQSNIFA